MGNRVLITFTDDDMTYTPAVYMHWAGEEAPAMIREFQKYMRKSDAGYAAARFCGECHLALSRGITGLGLVDAPRPSDPGFDWDEYSHGDAGVYLVNVTTGRVEARGGYGEAFDLPVSGFAAGS